MKKSSLLFIFILISIFSDAQDELTNLQKYWHYRYRLVNYFMVVGEGPGMSLPADIRNSYSAVTQNSGELRWGEAPIYLGYYIGVLATEYRLLKDNNQNTDRTLTELYYALKAAIRLDNVAESDNPWYQNNSTNGFLIRDDVPEGFVSNHSAELNLNISQGGITIGSGAPGIVTTTHSDYIENNNDPNHPENIAISQDIVYQFLIGFALVTKYIDNGDLTFYNYVTGSTMQVNLKTMSSDEADLIVNYIKGDFSHHWVLQDPNNNHVSVGWDCHWFAYGLARAGNYITGNDYTDFFSEHDYNLRWQDLQHPDLLLCNEIAQQGDAYDMALAVATMSNSWHDFLFNNTTPDRILENGDHGANASGTICQYSENHFGFDVFFGALWDAFYGGPRYISDLCKARDILNAAPFDGPFFHNENDNGMDGWRASRRFYDAPPRQSEGSSAFPGNYNGLDYMLLFNLYYLDSKQLAIASANAAPFYIPQGGVSDHYPYFDELQHVITTEEIHETASPIIFNSLSVTNSSQGIGNLTVHGGREGVLLTNTTVETGAYLLIDAIDNSCIGPQSSWYFDPSMYMRVMNPGTNSEQNIKSDVSLFPNPSSSSITISLPAFEISEPLIQIFNEQGSLVYEMKNESKQNITIDVSTFNKGLYLVKITDGDKVYAKKFIRE